jgi:hypothetical protein
MAEEMRKVTICIGRPADEAYAFLSMPQNFPKWASGLGKSLRKVGGEWIAETPEGPARVSFSEPNSFGVLDHTVALPHGGSVYIPLRVLPSGRGCELELTLIRRPGTSDEQFSADAAWVMRDLQAAKRILETGSE